MTYFKMLPGQPVRRVRWCQVIVWCIDLLVPAVRQLIQYPIRHAYQVISLIVASLEAQVVQVKRKLDELQVELGDVVRIIHLGPESPLAPRPSYATGHIFNWAEWNIHPMILYTLSTDYKDSSRLKVPEQQNPTSSQSSLRPATYP